MQVNNPLASFTRPNNTTTYAPGQLVANSVTAGAVVPLTINLGNSFGQGQFRLTRARLFKSGTGVTNATFRIHLYEKSPVCANGDGATWLTDSCGHWLGNIDVSSMLSFSDGAAGTGSCPAGSEQFIKTDAGSTLYGLLAALGAYTPVANEVFTLVLEEVDAY
ncbi:hypothetical protein [Bradyrhizobium sp.]|jgi:hypothetical protein|uniref:hypothetical protein n=1 Tax=Bradyrhizobium sp. TaxID=376 RepID=UPI003C277B9B